MHATERYRKTPQAHQGFTLIELLIVMGIMALIVGLTLPALTAVGGGRDAARAVTVAQSVAQAGREQALSKGAMVYLFLSPTNTAAVRSTNTQSLLLLQERISSVNSTATTNWIAGSPTVRIPQDVIMYAGTNGLSLGATTFNTNSSSGTITNLPSPWNTRLANYSYIAFYPDGSVNSPGNDNPTIFVQRANRNGNNTGPDYILMIQQSSGRTKVINNPSTL